jgi:hypothetical protein
MNPLIYTFYQHDYHFGVASLFNSAIRSGFTGRFCVFHNEEILPSWTHILTKNGDSTYQVDGCEIDFRKINPARHFGFQKPFAGLDLLNEYPDHGTFVYADPDVLFLAPWSFFEDWLSQGLCYCLDSNFPYLPNEHPWRATWRRVLQESTGKNARHMSTSPNSGFFGFTREESSFLEDWVAITKTFEKNGGNTSSFFLEERHQPIVSDQDLMGIALMGWMGRESVLGPEGMGFTGHYFLLAHDINRPKAWKRDFVRDAIKGMTPSFASSLFLKFCNSPIQAYSSMDLKKKSVALKIAKTLTRVWKR